MKTALVVFICLVAFGTANAEINWQLKKDKDSIKIYTASLENSSFKAVKVEFTVSGTFSQVVAVLFDIDRQKEWVYNDKYSTLLKRPQENEVIYYSEVSLPWPCNNRDFIAHLVVNQTSPDVVTMISHAEPDYIPVKKGIVRVKSSTAKWMMTAIGDHKIKIEYTVQFDPGGNVPPWLTNMFLTQGPYETFSQLQKRMDMPEYKDAHYGFINE